MLVLSRAIDQRILIGDEVRITIAKIRGSQVALGFEAPDGVNIWREELWLRQEKSLFWADHNVLQSDVQS